jgi:copper chaperone CopZ
MEKRLSVQGMTCQHCVIHVTKIIEKAPGVTGVKVSLASKEVLFTCAPSVINVPDIVKAINDFGFTAAEKG